MKLVEQLKIALRFQGIRAILRTVVFSVCRDWQDWRFKSQSPEPNPHPPGLLLGFERLTSGGRFHFVGASLEILFLKPDLARLTWTPGTRPVSYALVTREWEPVQVAYHEKGAETTLVTTDLQIQVNATGGLQYRDPAGNLLRSEEPPLRAGPGWIHHAQFQAQERVYGLGERAAPFNLRGRRYRLWNHDPGGSYRAGDDPLYMAIPVLVGLHAAGSYLVFYENPYRGQVDLTEAARLQFEGGALRTYFIPGPPSRALERYTELTGRPPLTPRWALGYHQSRWGYRTQEEVLAVLEGFQRHELPLSAIHLDIDYMDGYRVFSVDASRFPDLPALARKLHASGVKLVTILDCGVKRDPKDEVYQSGLAEGAFCELPSGKPAIGPVWPGWAVFPDFSDPRARAWWGAQYTNLLAMGVDGFWHDMNEPTAFAAWGDMSLPLSTRHTLEGVGGDHREAHNLYGLLMNQAGYEGLQRLQPDRRPWLLTRSGWAGVQRYAWHWTGDTASEWQSLRQTIPTLLGLGMSGVPFSGPDIGGFSGSPSATLFTRWFQLATFVPFFRNHAARGAAAREPWAFGQPYLGIYRACLNLRQRLLPYLYTLAWEASQTGAPLMRPLFWSAPDEPLLWDVEDAFMLGDALLVAPILEETASTRHVTLPPGGWYDFRDETFYEGPGEIEVSARLEDTPLLVRAGTVLPLADNDRLALHLYAPQGQQGEGRGIVYSDAGDGYGPWRLDRFHLQRTGHALTLTWEQQGDYLFPYPTLRLHLHGFHASQARMDGEPAPVEGDQVEVGFFRQVKFSDLLAKYL